MITGLLMEKRLIFSLAVALAGLVPALASAQGGGPALVRVALAEQQSLAPVIQVAGTVASRSDARLSAEVEGRLVSVVDVGTRVARGDALAKIGFDFVEEFS